VSGPVAARPGEVAVELQVEAAEDVHGAVRERAGRHLLGGLIGEDDRRRDREGEPPVAG
jgi:hypothetical protein